MNASVSKESAQIVQSQTLNKLPRTRSMTEETLFSKIIDKSLPADMVYQDEWVTAFRDINPAAPTHILIVPNRIIPTVDDIEDSDEKAMGRMLCVARDLARQEGIAEDGYRLIINCRENGHQEVPHLHMHLIGGRDLGFMVARES